jgi:hypothetical protein
MRRSFQNAAAIVALAMILPARLFSAETKTATATGESEYRNRAGLAATSRNCAVNRRQNSENARVVRPVQKEWTICAHGKMRNTSLAANQLRRKVSE